VLFGSVVCEGLITTSTHAVHFSAANHIMYARPPLPVRYANPHIKEHRKSLIPEDELILIFRQ